MFDKYIMSGRRRMFLKKLIWMQMLGLTGASLPWQTFTGNPLQFDAPKAHTLKSVKVEFSPKQDLHGYDAPWPAGGGANKWDGIWEQGEIYSNSGQDGNSDAIWRSVNYTPVVDSYQYVFISPNVTGNKTARARFYASDKSYIGYLDADGYQVFLNVPFNPPSGAAYIRFAPNISDIPDHIVALNYPSSVTTYSPYSNICPISGWTGLDMTRAGENLWGGEWQQGTFNNDGSEFYTTTRIRTDFVPVRPSTTYTLSSHTDNVYINEGYAYNKNNGFIQKVVTTAGASATFTTPASCAYIRWSAKYTDNSTITPEDGVKVQLSLGSTASPYAPYTGETISITWTDEAGTVYGGYVVINEDGSVDLVGEWAMDSVGNLNWVNDTVVGARRFKMSGLSNLIKKPTSTAERASNIMCDSLESTAKVFSAPASISNGIAIYSDGVVYAIDVNYSEASSFATAMADAEICYLLATPVTYHLPSLAEAIRCFKGINTMWTDADNLTVEAKAEAVNLSALQSLNMLLGGRYVNSHTEEDLTDEQALDVILGGQR